jgi:hypothetical protein
VLQQHWQHHSAALAALRIFIFIFICSSDPGK